MDLEVVQNMPELGGYGELRGMVGRDLWFYVLYRALEKLMTREINERKKYNTTKMQNNKIIIR